MACRDIMNNNKQLVIAHLSDLHLTASDDLSRSHPRILGTIKGMNEAFRKIVGSDAIREADLIIITGDITDRGDMESWKLFWQIIKDAGLSDRVLVVPGNHDVCCFGARKSFRKKTHRKTDLEKALSGLKIGNHEAKFPWARVFDKRVVVFGLNSNNLGNFTVFSNSMGRIGHDQLLSFAERLYEYRDIPVKLVVLHHCPNITKKTIFREQTRKLVGRLARVWLHIPKSQRRTLQLLCLSHGVKVIAHGHSHKAQAHIVNGVCIVGAPPTTEPISAINGKNVYQFYTYTICDRNSLVDTNLRTIQV